MQKGFNFETDACKSITDGLNKEQKKAVEHEAGPLLVIAGAGTGKTSVITKRIAYLIAKKLAKPSEILALTFTEKAAAEMEERVDMLVPYGFTDMWISTFHAFGDRLLRDHSIDLGLPVNFKVLTATEQAIFMRQNIYAFDLKHFRPIADPLSHIEAMLTHFSRLKDELISPEEYLGYAQSLDLKSNDDEHREEAEKTLELAHAYSRYSELMMQAGNLDFGDQIFLVYKLLKENKGALKSCQDRFKYILVDEYQDTNYAQNEMVKLLASKSGNITVVGDDDQSIYRFRGASISNILQFKTDYKDITQIVLNRNYRSTQEILDASYALIQHNNPDRLEVQNNINKKLISNTNGPAPALLHCDTLSCEADTVVKQISELKQERGYKYSDFAILVRANNQAEPFMQSLNLAGIPYLFTGASGLFAEPEIKMIVAFIKSIVYSDDSLSFYQLASSDVYRIDEAKLSEIYTLAKRKNRSVFETAKWLLGQNKLFSDDSQLNDLLTDIEKYRSKIKDLTAGELIYQYLTEKGYLKFLSANPSIKNELMIQNIARFFDRITQFSHSSSDLGLIAFINNLELIIDAGGDAGTAEINPDIDAVNILTVHAAKGLEWPVVFVVNMVSDRFPTRRRRDQLPIPEALIKEHLPEGDYHLEEERRLFYVASTRAKELLFLTNADDYGGKRMKKVSQFVLELLNEAGLEKLKHTLSPIEKIERFKEVTKNAPLRSRPEIGKTLKLSRAQIDDYFTCPKKYYFAHIIKIPLLENHYLMYGTAIHSALDHYFNRKIRKDRVTLEQLLQDFEVAFRNVGFITREHEDQRKAAGIQTLTRFYQYDQDRNVIPSSVEAVFEFLENNVRINGRYDLVYGKGETAEVWDFKTSQVKDQKSADKRIKESTQMQIYALSWLEKNKNIPKTVLYFIESGLVGEKTFTIKELEETKKMIFEVADGIRSEKYEAKPEQSSCKLCPYREICLEAL